DFLKPGEQVTPGAPAFLNSYRDTPAPDRLDFARWLVADDAPTTARTVVNRIWQAYFGQGLVTTPEDLGSQSAPPSHPELLDWLAVELTESGWDLKHIHKLIVTSNTYRQQAVSTEKLLAVDPNNQLLSRGARFRVRAEVVRDIALAASGLLNPEVGGPSVFPPAPEFLFKPPSSYGPKIWNLSNTSEQHRRSLYVHRYRSVPFPPLQVFDAPKGDAACIRRTRSNTPLQALVMLNEPQFVEIARALGQRIVTEGGTTFEDRLQYAFLQTLSRPAEAQEIAILKGLYDQQLHRIEAGEVSAPDLLGLTDSEENRTPQNQQLAAWTILARAILNLDETITRQ
ncbi:MAG: DUF1553 domain-containing protein, partial [Thiothrix sp.]|nr:DUF1553 domain-containing protein [Thiothrix sp.]